MSKISNRCQIYLNFGGKLKIPVNPEKIDIKYPTDHKQYEVLGIGKIVVPKKPSLKEISWESFFPRYGEDPYTNSGIKSPEDYVKKIEKAMKTRQKGRVIISRSGLYDTNMRCIVSDFQTTDKGGEPNEIYYSLTLQEYRDYSPETVSIVSTQESQPTQVTAEQEREVENPVLRVGATVIANGRYWYDSNGSKPYGTANNLSTTVTRIVSGHPYPVHIGQYGWLQESQLQITG